VVTKPAIGQLFFCSVARNHPTHGQLQALQEAGMRNSHNRGLSGVLLFGNGVFMHWLEGMPEHLDAALRTIVNDPEHKKVVVLWESKNAPERLFGDWVMGLRSPIVARDLLQVMHVLQHLHNAHTMLQAEYYDVFNEALDWLQRSCASIITTASGFLSLHAPPHAQAHGLQGPMRRLVHTMEAAHFVPYSPQAEVVQYAPAYHAELSSLESGESQSFKESMPMEHAPLIDMAASGMDDLLTLLDMPLRVALGQELWSRRKHLADKPLHWTYADKLVAVFDHATWKVGIHPDLTAAAYERTVVDERPRGANAIPVAFRHTTSYALLWDFADANTPGGVTLPQRYLSGLIRLTRAPPLPVPTLRSDQQHLLALLSKWPRRFDELAHAMALTAEPMTRLLAPFYAARCIKSVPG
jgi:Sensors of blue-light using FAD/DprA winged helix domain